MKRLLIALLFVISLTSFSTMVNLPIKSVEVVNNQQVPASLIKETLKLKEGARFSTEALLADFNALKETGYFEDVILQPISYDGGVRIVVDVVEKENVVDLLKEKGVAVNTLREDTDKSIVISSVKFTGNSRVTTAELLDITQLKAGEYFSRSRVEDAQRRLLATGKFSEVRPDAQVSNGKMALSFEVAENPIVKSIVITGNHTIPTSTIMSALTTKPGSVQNYNNLREDRDKILGLYQAQGYTLVNITDMSTDENGTLHISIVEGIVRKIEVKKMVTKQKGNRRTPNDDVLKTKDYVIDREIEIQPGKIFNVKEYDATVDNLMRLGIFKNVKYEARSIPGDPEGIDLILLIDEDSILFHEIDTIGFKVNIGKGLSKNFTLSLGTKVEYIKEAHEDGKLRKANDGKWYYNEKNKWREIEGVDDKYWLWSIYPYISYDTRNNYLNPTSGLYAKWQIEGGYAGGYKSGNFGNTTLELRTYHKGLFKNNTFAYKVVGGVATNNTKESQKFWVGGGNSLRGYDGGFFKGSQKLVATIENRTQLNDIIGIVVFADAGRAWKQNGRDPSYTRDNNRFGHNIGTTAGVGIRLNTPIGPLRFDFGWPVGNKMDDDGMKFYFNMGQSF